jgi:hypothetical protein
VHTTLGGIGEEQADRRCNRHQPSRLGVTIASALAADVGALELVTVTPPGTPFGVDRVELEPVAIQHGWLPAACTVLKGDDIAATLLQHLARRSNALLVIASHGRDPATSPDSRDVTRRPRRPRRLWSRRSPGAWLTPPPGPRASSWAARDLTDDEVCATHSVRPRGSST